MGRKKDPFGEQAPIEYPSTSARFTEDAIPIRTRKKYYGTTLRVIGISAMTFVVAIVLLLVFLTYRNVQMMGDNKDQLEESYNPSFRVRYDDIGKQVIESWFGEREPVIPYASNIRWPGPDGLNEEDPTVDPWKDQDTDTLPSVENVSFLYGDQNSIHLDETLLEDYPSYVDSYEESLTYYMLYNGKPMNVTVNLVVPNDKSSTDRPILVSTPTVEPAETVASYDNISSDPVGQGLQEADTTDDIDEALEEWADAWAENDTSTLKQMTQDDTDRLYFGMGDWRLAEGSPPSVNWMYEQKFGQKWSGLYYVAEIEFDIEQSIMSEPDPDSDDDPEEYSYTVTQTMNVLIENPDSTLPVIVSWGPSGSWQHLEPYSVGVDPEDPSIQQGDQVDQDEDSQDFDEEQDGPQLPDSPDESESPEEDDD